MPTLRAGHCSWSFGDIPVSCILIHIYDTITLEIIADLSIEKYMLYMLINTLIGASKWTTRGCFSNDNIYFIPTYLPLWNPYRVRVRQFDTFLVIHSGNSKKWWVHLICTWHWTNQLVKYLFFLRIVFASISDNSRKKASP